MSTAKNWGNRPWVVEFRAAKRALPVEVDFAIVGGGFTGLAAAAWLRKLDQSKEVALFEAGEVGTGSSGHTGGVALAETAAGDMPGLGDVLTGYRRITNELEVNGDLLLPGCYELARANPLPKTPICWHDSGDLCCTAEVPGGTVDPGKTVAGLARAAERCGAMLFERTNVEKVSFEHAVELCTSAGQVRAKKMLFATNAYAAELTGLRDSVQGAFTTAVMTAPLSDAELKQLGLGDRKPFYTVDLPYLWGRLLGNAVIFGSGLIFVQNWQELNAIDIAQGEAPEVFARLEKRIRRMSKTLEKVEFTNRWGGPICISEDWKPVFRRHVNSKNAFVLGAFSGHGVALSVYLGAWAAEVLLGKRALPDWK